MSDLTPGSTVTPGHRYTPRVRRARDPFAMGENHPVPATRADDGEITVTSTERPASPRARKTSATRTRRAAAPDAVCSAATDLARAAAESVADAASVGEHLGVQSEGDRLVTHLFACTARGYRGWRLAVTVTRVPRARSATVCEAVLLPGPESVLAPAWVPWSDRLAPGDLGTTDVLPFRSDDPCLEPGYTAADDEEADRVALWELGLGRHRVLSPLGRERAAQRWYTGERGPESPSAQSAHAHCSTCGYYVALPGAWRLVFGVCANEWSAVDGQVVSVDYGCGAHSETDVDRPEPESLPVPILDETGVEAVAVPRHVTGSESISESISEPTPESAPEPTPADGPAPAGAAGA